MKKKIFYLLFIILQLLLIFLVAEIATRYLRPQKTYSDLKKMVGNYYAESDYNYFKLKANYVGTEPSQEYPGQNVSVKINSLGLRGEEVAYEKKPGVKRILILGDSYTFGVYVGNEETYSSVLESKLRQAGYEVEVLNAGYAGGFETDQQYVWLMKEGLKYKPDIIILGFFHGNDITGIKEENWVEKDENGWPTKYKDPNMKVDENGIIRSNRNDNKTVGAEFIYRLPLLRESHFLIALVNKMTFYLSRLEARLNSSTLPPPGYSVVYYPQIFGSSTEAFYQKYYHQTAPEVIAGFKAKEEIFRKIVERMDQVAVENGAKFLLLMIPFNFEVQPEKFNQIIFRDKEEYGLIKTFKDKLPVDYFNLLKPTLAEKGIKYIDVLELMKTNPGHYYPDNGEVHLNPAGHIFVADQLQKYLLINKLIKK